MNRARHALLHTALLVLCQCAALAHDSPEHVIERLTEELARGATPELFYRRACEFRALRKYKQAEADLRAALKLEPEYLSAQTELASVLLAREKFKEAEQAATDGLALQPDTTAQAQLLSLRADALSGRKKYAEALSDIAAALRLTPDNIDLHLKQSSVLARLERHADRVALLARAFAQTQAAVLEIEWIEALLANAEFTAALARIEPQLDDARLASSWLIRRARCYLGMGRREFARADLQAALDEIDTRIHPRRRDPELRADRALAAGLLKAARTQDE